MKLSTLIKKLQKLQEQLIIDPRVLVDMDEHGYYNLEKVEATRDESDKTVINLKSSNEA